MTFEAHFAREMMESERTRLAVLAGLFGLLAVAFPLVAGIYQADYSRFFRSHTTLITAMALCAGLAGYLLLARYVLGRLLARGITLPRALRFVNAFVETSMPSVLMLLAMRELNPLAVLHGPPVFLYALFIVLSTLRLDFPLSVFTGAVAGVEYAALALTHAGWGDDLGTLAMLSAHGVILLKASLLLASGVAAGFVGAELRRRIRKVLRATEERQRVVNAFGQQVSPAIVDELLRAGPQLPSRRSFVCVMFMDIRDFTHHVEKRSPEEIVALQNAVFGVAIDVVNRHHGVINQFLGDGFMATFGAPLSSDDDCRNAVAAARELVSRIKEVRIGIGLHAGEAVTGNVGTELRKQYSVTGNVVILASRIEQLNKQFGSQLLISREVLRHAGDAARGAAPLGPVRLKGRDDAIEVYRVA